MADNLVQEDTNNQAEVIIATNLLIDSKPELIVVEKLINNVARETLDSAAQLLAGTQYGQSYKVTNNSANRVYQVQVFEGGNQVCN